MQKRYARDERIAAWMKAKNALVECKEAVVMVQRAASKIVEEELVSLFVVSFFAVGGEAVEMRGSQTTSIDELLQIAMKKYPINGDAPKASPTPVPDESVPLPFPPGGVPVPAEAACGFGQAFSNVGDDGMPF